MGTERQGMQEQGLSLGRRRVRVEGAEESEVRNLP